MAQSLFKKLFNNKKPIIGMIHVFEDTHKRQIEQAIEDLDRLQPYVDGVLIENYGWGYENTNIAEQQTANRIQKTAIEVINKSRIPVGINLLPNDYEKAFQICAATGARFIQLDHITGEFQRCDSVAPAHFNSIRKRYRDIIVFGGIHPKYYRLLNPRTSISQSANKAKRLAHAIVVTGEKTGGATGLDDLYRVKKVLCNKPLVIGSGLTAQNALEQLAIADAAIVGSAFKTNGVEFGSQVNESLVRQLMDQVTKLRKNPF